ncbi:MAG: hypothetical protein EPO24_10745 [Bacteroidetes bacterium]|nr:MAG: hypothetical protein EPO24_10745 [Bacteroidota bacterium]
MKLSISVPSEFNLKSTIFSHGWCELLPFSNDRDDVSLTRLIDLSSGKIISAQIKEQRTKSNNALQVVTSSPLNSTEQKEVKSLVRTSLRLDEHFTEFYAEASKHKEFFWVPAFGAGRLLRSQTVFEDVVKMICTTNCSWALTEIMVENLCKKLGKKFSDSNSNALQYCFPDPEAIAGTSEKFLRKEIRAGYRAPYLLELSKRIVKKEIDIEAWRTLQIPTDELFQQVRSVKGVGPYAAGNLLKLLGHYDYLAIDSWCRKKFFEKHKNGRTTSDKVIEKYYRQFGKWQGLFLWMDLTQYWYEKEFAF